MTTDTKVVSAKLKRWSHIWFSILCVSIIMVCYV